MHYCIVLHHASTYLLAVLYTWDVSSVRTAFVLYGIRTGTAFPVLFDFIFPSLFITDHLVTEESSPL